jgi:TonB family protein
MILLLLKLTLLLAATLAASAALRRSSAAMRHLICACGLAGALLLALTLIAPPSPPAFRISALSAPTTARLTRTATGFALPLLQALPWLWLAGTAILLARIAAGYGRLAVALRRAQPTADAGVFFADVSVPVAVGLLRPAILLPHSAAEWPAERFDAALRHERVHLRRKDLWTLLLSHVACAAYWFHPLVWIVAAQLREEQEQACDDAVVLSGLPPDSYAEALLAAAQNLTSTRLIGCHMLTQKTFRSRIARLLANGLPRVSSSSTMRGAAIVFAGAVIAIGLVSGKPQQQDQAEVQKVGNGVSQPSVISKVDPEYTPEAHDAKVEGPVLLSIVIGTDGKAHDINVVRKLGSGLDEKAVEAVQKWVFKPGYKDGEPVRVRAQIEVNFKLL